MLDASAIAPETIRPLRRAEYDVLVAQGALDDERVELLEGFLVSISPQGPMHATVIRRLIELLVPHVGAAAQLQIQAPLALSMLSEPEPDVAVIPRGDYTREHPRTALLIVEVADTSLRKDRGVKPAIYARAGVPEYWVVNLRESVIEVWTAPSTGDLGESMSSGVQYSSRQCHGRGQAIELVSFPGVAIPVDAVLGPEPA